ncbi:SPOSA6832_00915, partial [Sporobolomyces salmonicolor]
MAASTAAVDQMPPPVQDAVPVPSSTGRPSHHSQRYDRQLRLWASSGQSALENANLLVVNANATATSALKNLVLPGIGKFTLLDPSTVQPNDIGNNFFLEPDSLGKSRAEEAVKFLCELNTDVTGVAIVQVRPPSRLIHSRELTRANMLSQSLADLLSSSPTSIGSYSLIIAVDVPPAELLQLADEAWKQGVPLVKVQSCGFYGALRVQVEELPIVETHPESLIDLRVHSPFPSLVAYAHSFDYATMDTAEHGHVPAVVILVKALEAWKAAHEGNGPTGAKERKEFMDAVLKQKVQSDEENFDEAVTLFRRAGTRTGIPPDIQRLFDDPACENVSASVCLCLFPALPSSLSASRRLTCSYSALQSSNFWLLLHAVRSFTTHPSNPSALLPLSGALPDMKADSKNYVSLQALYRAKAREDLGVVQTLLGELMDRLGVERSRVSEGEVETFVKHSAWLKVVRGRSLRQEHEDNALKGQIESLLAAASFQSPPDASLHIYLSLLASDVFYVRHARYPGDVDGPASVLESDAEELEGIAREVLKGLEGGDDGEVSEDLRAVIKEVYTSALLGGLVAQEAIKLVTRQYVPLSGTCVWDGVRSGTGVLEA